MHIIADTLDDALRKLYPRIIAEGKKVVSTRGQSREVVAALIEIKMPRARLSRSEMRGKPFSCLGELCWYLAKDNRLDFITYYIPRYERESDDGKTVYGAYGPRLFEHNGIDQISSVIKLLGEKPTSRRAVIQLFDAQDLIGLHKEIPCTTSLQFLLREGCVDLIVSMRSNDAYKGLPHDVFCFTMLQEIVARSIGARMGTYRHFAGSMHIYESENEEDNEIGRASTYLTEAVQPRIEMPKMPAGDPWPSLKLLLEAEVKIRKGEMLDISSLALDPYWADLLRLLQVFAARGNDDHISTLQAQLTFKKYATYIEAQKGLAPRKSKRTT